MMEGEPRKTDWFQLAGRIPWESEFGEGRATEAPPHVVPDKWLHWAQETKDTPVPNNAQKSIFCLWSQIDKWSRQSQQSPAHTEIKDLEIMRETCRNTTTLVRSEGQSTTDLPAPVVPVLQRLTVWERARVGTTQDEQRLSGDGPNERTAEERLAMPISTMMPQDTVLRRLLQGLVGGAPLIENRTPHYSTGPQLQGTSLLPTNDAPSSPTGTIGVHEISPRPLSGLFFGGAAFSALYPSEPFSVEDESGLSPRGSDGTMGIWDSTAAWQQGDDGIARAPLSSPSALLQPPGAGMANANALDWTSPDRSMAPTLPPLALDLDIHEVVVGSDDAHDDELACPVCLESLTQGERMVQLPCACQTQSVGYHRACIQTWLLDHRTCPTCRQVIF